MRYIDSHQHCWRLSRGDYDWLTPSLSPLYRDFLPHDIAPHIQQHKIDGTILVQAAATCAETDYLLALAKQHSFILGVVGWIDMLADDACDQLSLLKSNKYFRGIRPMLQDIADPNWMLQPAITPVLQTLAKLNLTFDALIKPLHLPNLLKIIERHPQLNIVIDHGGKPNIAGSQFEPWASQIKTLAQHPNVYCKLSGLITEAGTHWSWNQIQPYIDHLFNCFSEKRIMWGSDFPVLNLASHYQEWHALCHRYVQVLGQTAYDHVFGKTAAEFYSV